MPEVDWDTAIRHLPLVEIMESVDGPKGAYSELIRRGLESQVAKHEGGK